MRKLTVLVFCSLCLVGSSLAEARPHRDSINKIKQKKQNRFANRHHLSRLKDLAQLAYSAPCEQIGCRQKVAFVRQYLGVDKLRPGYKQIIRWVLAKQHRMERRRRISR